MCVFHCVRNFMGTPMLPTSVNTSSEKDSLSMHAYGTQYAHQKAETPL